MGLILITHDLGVVAEVADRVVVMYAGREVESGEIGAVYHSPAHPYTIGLMDSLPRPDVHTERLHPIKGAPPDLLAIPSGCPFHPRCPYVRPRCRVGGAAAAGGGGGPVLGLPFLGGGAA